MVKRHPTAEGCELGRRVSHHWSQTFRDFQKILFVVTKSPKWLKYCANARHHIFNEQAKQ